MFANRCIISIKFRSIRKNRDGGAIATCAFNLIYGRICSEFHLQPFGECVSAAKSLLFKGLPFNTGILIRILVYDRGSYDKTTNRNTDIFKN